MYTEFVKYLKRGMGVDDLIDALRSMLGQCNAALTHRGSVTIDDQPIQRNTPRNLSFTDPESGYASLKVQNWDGWVDGDNIVHNGFAFFVLGPVGFGRNNIHNGAGQGNFNVFIDGLKADYIDVTTLTIGGSPFAGDYVPYTGADDTVELNTQTLDFNSAKGTIDHDGSEFNIAAATGDLDLDGAVDVYINATSGDVQIGAGTDVDIAPTGNVNLNPTSGEVYVLSSVLYIGNAISSIYNNGNNLYVDAASGVLYLDADTSIESVVVHQFTGGTKTADGTATNASDSVTVRDAAGTGTTTLNFKNGLFVGTS